MSAQRTSLDDIVKNLLEVAKARGELVADDFNQLRHDLGLAALDSDYFFQIVLSAIADLSPQYLPHARLLLRLDECNETLTRRRAIATDRYRVSNAGSARVERERYVLTYVIYNVLQHVNSGLSGGQGYEFEAVRLRYWFENDDPDQFRVDAEFDLRIVRNDVRVFTFGSDATAGSFYDIRCLSEDLGHRLLGQIPVRASAPNAEHYAFFYLGGSLTSSSQTTISLREFWNNSGEPSVREHGVAPASRGGPLSITLDAPASLVSHYATFMGRYERPNRPAPTKLTARDDDDPITITVDRPLPDHLYGFWYKVVSR